MCYTICINCRALEFLESCRESTRSILESGPPTTGSSLRRSRGDRSTKSGKTTPRSSMTSKSDTTIYQSLEIGDFQLLKVLGIGGFGRVRLARIIPTNEIVVLKTQSKVKIVSKSMESTIVNEIQLMRMMSHPYIARLYCAFQDKYSIHMAIELLQGGDFFSLLKREGKYFSESKAVFYSAIIVLALEAIHKEKIAYRDLKVSTKPLSEFIALY